MQNKLLTSTLTILLATSSWQTLPAYDTTLEQQELSRDLATLQVLLKYSAPAIAPFMQPIHHGFIDGGLISIPAAVAGLAAAKPMLGKFAGAGKDIFKWASLASAAGAVWAVVVKTIGGADAATSDYMLKYFGSETKRFLERHHPTVKALTVEAKNIATKTTKQQGKIKEYERKIPGELNKTRETIDKATTEFNKVAQRAYKRLLAEKGRRRGHMYKLADELARREQRKAEHAATNDDIKTKNKSRKPSNQKSLRDEPYQDWNVEATHESYNRVLGQLQKFFEAIRENQ